MPPIIGISNSRGTSKNLKLRNLPITHPSFSTFILLLHNPTPVVGCLPRPALSRFPPSLIHCLLILRIPPFPIGLFGSPSRRPKSKLSFGNLLGIEDLLSTSFNPFSPTSLSPISNTESNSYLFLHCSFSWRFWGRLFQLITFSLPVLA